MLKLFRRSDADAAAASDERRAYDIGPGRRVYAIGDIHGRCDLLNALVLMICADHGARDAVGELRIVLLGDLLDRGPQAREVVDFAIRMTEAWSGFTCLKGNHEEVFASAFRGDGQALRFVRQIGRETLTSYGIDEAIIDSDDDHGLMQAILTHVPAAHRDYIMDLPDYLEVGDYVFVHAGIRPGVDLGAQKPQDLHWIRGEFLKSAADHGAMIVHGHSITATIDEQANRIGIDTGAYYSDTLSAIGLQGTERWYLST